jgi:hypothetical protein
MTALNGDSMSGKPSRVKQREIQQIIKGAMKGGATKVVVRLGEACIEAHLPTGAANAAAEPDGQITL